MKKITPKKVPFEKYLEFVKQTHWKPEPKDDEWFVEHRWGWGLSPVSKKRFDMLKDDPDPVILELTDIPPSATFYRYAVISDKFKYAITIDDSRAKDLIEKIWPGIELDLG